MFQHWAFSCIDSVSEARFHHMRFEGLLLLLCSLPWRGNWSMSQLSCFRSWDVWNGCVIASPSKLSRESTFFFCLCLEIVTLLGQSCLRKHLFHHQKLFTKELFRLLTFERNSRPALFCYQMCLYCYNIEAIIKNIERTDYFIFKCLYLFKTHV